jgi:hypothetical protein
MVACLHASHPDLRVVYSSGYTERAVKGSDLVAHGAAFLAKPFTPDELARVVDETLAAGDGSEGDRLPHARSAARHGRALPVWNRLAPVPTLPR